MRASFRTTSNPRMYKMLRKKYIWQLEGKCSYCPPHGGENRTRSYKHPVKKSYQLNPGRGFKRIRIASLI